MFSHCEPLVFVKSTQQWFSWRKERSSVPFKRVCVKESVTEGVKLIFYSFFVVVVEAAGHCVFKVHISQVSHNMSFFLSQRGSLSHDQSANRKGQGCDSCILLPILPRSVHLILTQKDSANSFPQISATMCEQACPSSAITKPWDLISFVKCVECVSVCVCVYSDHSSSITHCTNLLSGFLKDKTHLLFRNRYASHNSSQWNNSEVCPFHDRALIHHEDKHPKFISTLAS